MTLSVLTLSPPMTPRRKFELHSIALCRFNNSVPVSLSCVSNHTSVSQSKHDALDSIKSTRAVGELETLVSEVLNELNGVVGGFTLSVGGDDEDRSTSFGELIEVLKVVFLWVAYEGSDRKPI